MEGLLYYTHRCILAQPRSQVTSAHCCVLVIFWVCLNFLSPARMLLVAFVRQSDVYLYNSFVITMTGSCTHQFFSNLKLMKASASFKQSHKKWNKRQEMGWLYFRLRTLIVAQRLPFLLRLSCSSNHRELFIITPPISIFFPIIFLFQREHQESRLKERKLVALRYPVIIWCSVNDIELYRLKLFLF